MPKYFLQRVVPFTLALLVGVAASSFLGWTTSRTPGSYGSWREGKRNRTALVIRSMPTPKLAQEGEQICEGCSVRMRVMFGADGTVSGNEFQVSQSSYALIEEASAAARRIAFSPATRNGRPVPVWADVTYTCGDGPAGPTFAARCNLTIDHDSVRTARGRWWRVITSNE